MKSRWMLVFLSFVVCWATTSAGLLPAGEHAIMRFTPEERLEGISRVKAAPRAYIDPALRPKMGSVSLLSLLQYTPSERDQSYCGNCWAWAGTGVMEIALNVQRGIKDRLSVQYMNSCFGTGDDFACCGGWLEDLADFYSRTGYRQAVPWSNGNASWQDGARECGGATSRACGTISTAPNYPINSITATTINTWSIGTEAAISNIKNVLNQNKAVSFEFYMGQYSEWLAFYDFWDYQDESAVFNFNFSCGSAWDDDNGGGHAVLCVGYNDNDPNNRYWIMLNSWGTTAGRPNGLFRVTMDLNYDCLDGTWLGPNLFWETLDMSYAGGPGPKAPWLTDYNGDGTSDLAIFRPASGLWAVRQVTRAYFGSSSDLPVPGDYSGDGTTDIAIFRGSSGLWAVKGGTRTYFGSSADEPFPGDYNGDGTVDIGLFRPTSGLWAIRQVTRMYFGSSADTPIPGYYSGTGASPGIFRPASGLWAIKGITRTYFGSSSDEPVPGDYNGDGSWNLGIFRGTSGLWAVKGVTRAYFGSSTDLPVPGGYRGDGKDYLGIFRGTSGLWAIKGVTRTYFGSGNDVPVTR